MSILNLEPRALTGYACIILMQIYKADYGGYHPQELAPKRARLPEYESMNGVPLSLHSAFSDSSPTPSNVRSLFQSPPIFASLPPATPSSTGTQNLEVARSTSASTREATWTLNKPPAKKRSLQVNPASTTSSKPPQSSQAPGRQSRKENRVGPTEGNLAFYSTREQPLIQHMKRLLLGKLIASSPWAESKARERLITDAFDDGMQSDLADGCGDLTLSTGLNRLVCEHLDHELCADWLL